MTFSIWKDFHGRPNASILCDGCKTGGSGASGGNERQAEMNLTWTMGGLFFIVVGVVAVWRDIWLNRHGIEDDSAVIGGFVGAFGVVVFAVGVMA